MDRSAAALAALGRPLQQGQSALGPWQQAGLSAVNAVNGMLVISCNPKRLKPRGTWKKLRRCRCKGT